MSRFKTVLLSASLLAFPACTLAAPTQAPQPPPAASAAPAVLSVPAATKVELLLTRPVWAATAKTGDEIYAQTSFPVVAGSAIAIPAGTYVQGTIENVTRPTRKSNRAEIQVLFTKIIFADGYVITLPGDEDGGLAAAGDSANAATQPPLGETLIDISIQVTTANDLLLDNAADIEMTLGTPLHLDANEVAQSIPLSRAPQPGEMKSASQCVAIPGDPGTPGTPDTVIPGSPGTPSTTIPGGPGMPDITIPGTPATPPTVIPGTPGTPGSPGIACPPKPIVLSCTLIDPSKAAPTVQPTAER